MSRLSGIIAAVSSAAMTILILLVWSAQIRSCFVSSQPIGSAPTPHLPDAQSPSDQRIAGRLQLVWSELGTPGEVLSTWVIDDPDVNAASLGDGVFVLWRGLDGLPDDAIDAVLAHELAHDQLRHSKKAAEMSDVTDFVADALAIWSGSDGDTTTTLKRWTGNLVIPRYSRRQEAEADARAVLLLGLLGYPDGAATMCFALQRLRDRNGKDVGGWLSSHPPLSERIRLVGQLVQPSAAAGTCE